MSAAVLAPPPAALGWWINRRTLPISATSDRRRLDALMGRVAGGDRGAFAELYQAISGPVFGTIRRIIRDEAMAEEIAHDVLVEVWQKAPLWDSGRGSSAGWIMTVARHRAIDRVRSEASRRDREDRVAQRGEPAAPDPVAESVVDQLDRNVVTDSLRGLTDLQREVIELAYYAGKTQRQIADSLDVPLGTVKSRVRDALTKLKEAVGND